MPSMWAEPIIYHIIVDRFNHGGSPTSHVAEQATFSEKDLGVFYGGNIKGITEKIREGWFADLGVNIILISPICQQISGWVPSAGKDFRHYGYHGYFTLDYTIIDRRFGSGTDLHEMIHFAHASGIGVLLDVVVNHPGYPEPATFEDLGIGGWYRGWENADPNTFDNYIDRDSLSFNDWWGADWVRYSLPGYSPGGNDNHTMLLHGLPDFKTESEHFVALPKFFKNKADTRAVNIPCTTVRGYLVKWLSDWVLEYGFDGFRCDSVKHVEPETWKQLKLACSQAKRKWWDRQKESAGATPDFWMLGEVFGHGVGPSSYYECGFDSLINFSFQEDIKQAGKLDALYRSYTEILHNCPGLDCVSYISSHDTRLFNREQIWEASSALMLSPGGVLLFYGDETGRSTNCKCEHDPAQVTRSPMNWATINQRLFSHWRRLVHFRARHCAIARGSHLKVLDRPYTFARIHPEGDGVLVAMAVEGRISLPVNVVFSDGQHVRDAYSGWCGVVENGHILLNAEGLVLLEADCDDRASSMLSSGGNEPWVY